MLENILNWKLLASSHEFPGPDGGTCITEAAIVAAGFEYREIGSFRDCPPCFSPPIAAYAICLNDAMPDDLRQELLMPFVTRLAGTADSEKMEIERARYIAMQTVKRIVPIARRATGVRYVAELADHASIAFADTAPAQAVATAAAVATFAAGYAAAAVGHAAAAGCTTASTDIFTVATAILDEAIRLGNQGAPIDVELVVGRLQAAKRQVREPAVVEATS
jgi:hypothetical protein